MPLLCFYPRSYSQNVFAIPFSLPSLLDIPMCQAAVLLSIEKSRDELYYFLFRFRIE